MQWYNWFRSYGAVLACSLLLPVATDHETIRRFGSVTPALLVEVLTRDVVYVVAIAMFTLVCWAAFGRPWAITAMAVAAACFSLLVRDLHWAVAVLSGGVAALVIHSFALVDIARWKKYSLRA